MQKFNKEQLKAAKQLFESHDKLEDKLYVLYVVRKLLQITYPFAKDKVGYTFPDAWLYRDMLLRDVLYPDKFPHGMKFTNHNVEWLRRNLLKYEKQIKKLGLDYGRLNCIRISTRAIYWKRLQRDSTFSVTIEVSNSRKQVKITVAYRLYKQRKREKTFAVLELEDGISLLRKVGIREMWVPSTSEIDDHKLEIKIGIRGKEVIAKRLVEELGFYSSSDSIPQNV